MDERVAVEIRERLADLTVTAFIQIDIDGRQLIAAINGVVAACIPDSFEDRLVGIPFIDVIAGLPQHVGTVQTLHRNDVQHHRRRWLIGVVAVVAHHCEVNIVQRRIQQELVGRTGIERVLEAQRMADFMHERHVVVSALARIRVAGFRTDPDVTGGRKVVRKVSPCCGFIVHQPIATKTQVANIAHVVAGQGESEVGNGTPCTQGIGDCSLLSIRQFVQRVIFVFWAVKRGEI